MFSSNSVRIQTDNVYLERTELVWALMATDGH